MATQRDLQPPDAGDRRPGLDRLEGYVLGADVRAEDVLEIEAELLRSEGIDPAWPGFDKT